MTKQSIAQTATTAKAAPRRRAAPKAVEKSAVPVLADSKQAPAAFDAKKYFGLDTANVASMNDIFAARENAAFHKHFVGAWNSGAGSRDYEYFCRHTRQSMGLNHFFVTRNFILRNPETGFETAVEFLAKEGYQILFASEQVAWVMLVQDNVPIFYGEIGVRDKVLQATFEGDREMIKKLASDMARLFPEQGLETRTLVGFGQQGPIEKTQYLYPKEIDLAKTHFYPWLEKRGETLEEFFDGYMNDRDPILLLIGAPGTGKSTLLRTMLLHFGRKHNSMCSDSKVLMNDAFTSWLVDRPDNSFLAIEDADTLIESRERGNNSMSAILNSSQGIIPNKTKLVISTNLPSINSVDKALTRVGRTHDIIEFSTLTGEQLNRIREIEGLPTIKTVEGKEYTLAEALTVKKARKGEVNRAPRGIGFIG